MLRPKCVGKLLDEDKTLRSVFLGVYTEFLHTSRTFVRLEDIFFSFFFFRGLEFYESCELYSEFPEYMCKFPDVWVLSD